MVNGVEDLKAYVVGGVWFGEYMDHSLAKSMKELDMSYTMLTTFRVRNLGNVRLRACMILKKNFTFSHWKEKIIAMIPPQVKPQLPKPEVKIEIKLLKPEIIVEDENQCDVEVDTTSVEASTEVLE
ncbi:hypothetical protein Tco_0871794 [Tanacetum coccineum]